MNERLKITPELTVGQRQPDWVELLALVSEGFRTVIDLRTDDEPGQDLSPRQEALAARRLGLAYCHVPVPADRVDAGVLDRFRAALADAVKPVFVHCASGKRAG